MKSKFIPVVLSGGVGSRLWPVSRASIPKQFCEFLNESLLEKSLKRLEIMGSPWTLTTQDLSVLTGRIFSKMNLPKSHIIFEPMGRNTAPAIALLCWHLQNQSRTEDICGIFPADHLIINEQAFAEVLDRAKAVAETGFVVTLGIKPEYPSTGFGYIEISKHNTALDQVAHKVTAFREKPDEETAKKFIKSGNFYWNAGIFIFKVSTMIANFKKLMPELWENISEIKSDLSNLTSVYSKLKSESIDYGIMEKLDTQMCLPCDIGWSDLGSWDDIARFSEPPFNLKMANHAKVQAHNSHNNFVFSNNKKLCALVDVDNLIVVDTADALLISKRGLSQNVKHIVASLQDIKESAGSEHIFEMRPWGSFTVLRDEKHFKSKIISVDGFSQISYQSHAKRAEHWIMVSGKGEVILDDKVIPISKGENVFIPKGSKHRIRNTQPDILEFIEVQVGSYFGEDDIVRYEDDYQRV